MKFVWVYFSKILIQKIFYFFSENATTITVPAGYARANKCIVPPYDKIGVNEYEIISQAVNYKVVELS